MVIYKLLNHVEEVDNDDLLMMKERRKRTEK